MGQEPSIDQRINRARLRLRLTRHDLSRLEKHAEAEATKLRGQVKLAIQRQASKEAVRELAECVVRQTSLASRMRSFKVRTQAIDNKLSEAVALRHVNTALVTAVGAMSLAEQAIPLEELTNVLEQFERSSENAEVHAAYLDETLESSMRSMTPAASVDAVLSRIGDECQLEVSSLLSAAPRRLPESARGETSLGATTKSAYGENV